MVVLGVDVCLYVILGEVRVLVCAKAQWIQGWVELDPRVDGFMGRWIQR